MINYAAINSIKIEEICMENFVYNENSQNIYNPTHASDMIMFENINYTPSDAVEFVAGNRIFIGGNVKIAPQRQGSVKLKVDANICPDNVMNNSDLMIKNILSDLPSNSAYEFQTTQSDSLNGDAFINNASPFNASYRVSISGKVIDNNKNPISHTCITVKYGEIEKNSIYTDENGEFSTLLCFDQQISGMSYDLIVGKNNYYTQKVSIDTQKTEQYFEIVLKNKR
jgi:hypothetical protein